MKIFLMPLLLFSALCVCAQSEKLFEGISLGLPLQEVKDQLESRAGKLYIVEVAEPSFPLASKTESHLICLECQVKKGSVEEVAFTFADDKLSLIQARGRAAEAIWQSLQDTAQSYMDYKVYWDDLIFVKEKEDKFWILNQDAAHPNLFTWDNPFLPSQGGKAVVYEPLATIPAFIRMGASMEEIKLSLEGAAVFINVLELGPDDPNAQWQIDGFGIPYAGFPRKFEARFGDGKLNMVWILTAKAEEDRIRQKLIDSYGNPIFTNEAWEVFENWQVFLRKDKPEILLLSRELGSFYKKDYFGQ